MKKNFVVPLAGTWIETGGTSGQAEERTVVPLAGTWIETLNLLCNKQRHPRRSPCGNVD